MPDGFYASFFRLFTNLNSIFFFYISSFGKLKNNTMCSEISIKFFVFHTIKNRLGKSHFCFLCIFCELPLFFNKNLILKRFNKKFFTFCLRHRKWVKTGNKQKNKDTSFHISPLETETTVVKFIF